MDAMPTFELKRPNSIGEAAALLAANPTARLIAGGTDLLPNMRRGIGRPPVLVDLGAVRNLAAIERHEGGLSLGAATRLSQLASDPTIRSEYSALAQAAASIAGPSHRSVATIGGNLCLDTRCVFYNQSEWWRASNNYCLKLGGDTCHVAPQGNRCHAAFSGDAAAALIVFGAQVELVSNRGTRRIALTDMYRDDGAAHLTIERDEILVRVLLPAPSANRVSAYRKSRARAAIDFPLAGVACALRLRDGVLQELRIALTGTNSSPIELAGTEAMLGRELNDDMIATLGKLVQRQVSPMRTTVTHANYRRQVAAVMAQRLVRELARDSAGVTAGSA